MTDETTEQGREGGTDATGGNNVFLSSRRAFLAIGAVTASTVVTIKPALASTAGSILHCEIPIRDYIGADGEKASPGAPGAAPPKTFKGEDVKKALGGGRLPGTSSEENDAYIAYIKKLQRGQSGFTCYASLQNPRR